MRGRRGVWCGMEKRVGVRCEKVKRTGVIYSKKTYEPQKESS